jgi:RNA polymerase sigma-70 factor (ECF subfamily)
LARSEQAFGELVRRHAGFVLATCRRRLRDGHDAEDAAQAVFLVLARRPPARSGPSVQAGWLYKTAVSP